MGIQFHTPEGLCWVVAAASVRTTPVQRIEDSYNLKMACFTLADHPKTLIVSQKSLGILGGTGRT